MRRELGCWVTGFAEDTLIYSNNKSALVQVVLAAIEVVLRGSPADPSSGPHALRANVARHALMRHQEALLWA